MRRRQLLGLGLAAPCLSACDPLDLWARWRLPLRIHQPGLREGHWLRERPRLPAISSERRVDTAIIGSGIGGLSTAYKLQREGFKDFLLLQGPEPFGNAAAGRQGELPFPLGAHYLPVPTPESWHVREILADAGILLGPPQATVPEYQETALIHAPEDRLLINGRWQEGLLPTHGINAAERAQQARFFSFTDRLKQQYGADGRRLFALPLALSSQDARWRALDRLSFAAWLAQEGYTAPSLLWYLDYCCRDDYGAGLNAVSAWAGLHYFACRSGQARHTPADTVLTWPDGLNTLARHLWQPCQAQGLAGFALSIEESAQGVSILYADRAGPQARIHRIQARRAVLALPLHVAARITPSLKPLLASLPEQAPWLVSNFRLSRFPQEQAGAELAWDNVVYQGRGLGYVVATHQLIRSAKPAETVFTAYQALHQPTPADSRRQLLQASASTLLDEASADLHSAYGESFWRHVTGLDITVRGHAMAIPTPGFLQNAGRDALRAPSPRLLFAHADLSGLSLFEEASWWGYQAALTILGT